MDDIQLCKDIMSLKQELRQIVAVPGTAQSHRHTKLLNSVKIKRSSSERVRAVHSERTAAARSSPESHNLVSRQGDL